MTKFLIGLTLWNAAGTALSAAGHDWGFVAAGVIFTGLSAWLLWREVDQC
jgi:hypothetical protein